MNLPHSLNVDFKKGKLLSGVIYPEFFPIFMHETVLNVGCGDGVQALVYEGKFKKMVGVDINQNRLETAKKLTAAFQIKNFSAICTNAEHLPLDEKFDKIIAIDIIEHVINPSMVIAEIYRLLKEDGRLLITFPAMHDKWESFFRFIGRKVLRRKGRTIIKEGWDPDQHQYNYNLNQWLDIMKKGNFELISSRASTLFPPLHYLGLPKFWFSNKLIHTIDNFFCQTSLLKNYGQALVCVFKKNTLC